MKTVSQIAADLDMRVCLGGCGLSATRHREGCIDPFLQVHFAERRKMTHRAARNLLLLLAKAQRMADPGYLNIDVFDFYYIYSDSVAAARMARDCGFRLPARLFDDRRRICRDLAARRWINLSKYPRVYSWSRER